MDCRHACTDCKYFYRHYIINNHGQLSATYTGHCVNGKIRDNVSAKHVRKDEGWALWQPRELQKLSIQYGIEAKLIEINKSIKEFLSVLRDMEK